MLDTFWVTCANYAPGGVEVICYILSMITSCTFIVSLSKCASTLFRVTIFHHHQRGWRGNRKGKWNITMRKYPGSCAPYSFRAGGGCKRSFVREINFITSTGTSTSRLSGETDREKPTQNIDHISSILGMAGNGWWSWGFAVHRAPKGLMGFAVGGVVLLLLFLRFIFHVQPRTATEGKLLVLLEIERERGL